MGQGRWKGGPLNSAGRPLTIALIAGAVVASLATGSFNSDFVRGPLYQAMLFASPGVPPWSQILQGEVWRLVTPIFLHYGFVHLAFNSYMLYQFGSTLERKFGTPWLAAFVLISAVISNVAQYTMALEFYQRVGAGVFGGFSGVVYALFGFFWIRGRVDFTGGLFLQPSTVWILLGWLVICYTGMLGPVANEAHLAGLIVGMAWGAYPELVKR